MQLTSGAVHAQMFLVIQGNARDLPGEYERQIISPRVLQPINDYQPSKQIRLPGNPTGKLYFARF